MMTQRQIEAYQARKNRIEDLERAALLREVTRHGRIKARLEARKNLTDKGRAVELEHEATRHDLARKQIQGCRAGDLAKLDAWRARLQVREAERDQERARRKLAPRAPRKRAVPTGILAELAVPRHATYDQLRPLRARAEAEVKRHRRAYSEAHEARAAAGMALQKAATREPGQIDNRKRELRDRESLVKAARKELDRVETALRRIDMAIDRLLVVRGRTLGQLIDASIVAATIRPAEFPRLFLPLGKRWFVVIGGHAAYRMPDGFDPLKFLEEAQRSEARARAEKQGQHIFSDASLARIFKTFVPIERFVPSGKGELRAITERDLPRVYLAKRYRDLAPTPLPSTGIKLQWYRGPGADDPIVAYAGARSPSNLVGYLMPKRSSYEAAETGRPAPARTRTGKPATRVKPESFKAARKRIPG